MYIEQVEMETPIDKWINWQELFLLSLAFASLFVVAELLYHKAKVKVEYTRKFVHIITGIITLFFPLYLNPLDLFIICIGFGIFLAGSKKLGFFQSVNAIDRPSQGSILFPVVVIAAYFAQFYLENYLYFMIPIMILSLADPVAALVGGNYPLKKYSIWGNSKSIGGSIGFLLTASLITFLGIHFWGSDLGFSVIICALSVGIITTIAEAVSLRGFDNLLVPLAAVLMLWLFKI